MCVYDDIDKKTALGIINSLVNTDGAEKGITVSREFLKALLSALNDNEQNDCVKWHPYPQEKPDTDRDCLITTNICNRGVYGVDVGWQGPSGWHSGDELYAHDEVVAWAELPKPYEKGAEDGTD